MIQYCAGFFDGEGCIYIRKDNRVRLHLAQNVLPPLDLFQSLYGGNIYSTGPPPRRGFQLIICKKKDVIHCLIDLEPYLLVKGNKAREALKLLL